jgi:hypothetical protein
LAAAETFSLIAQGDRIYVLTAAATLSYCTISSSNTENPQPLQQGEAPGACKVFHFSLL